MTTRRPRRSPPAVNDGAAAIDPRPAPEASTSRAVRGIPSLVARQALTAGVSVGSSVLLARMLSPAEFGLFALLLTFIAVVRIVTDGGLGAALVRHPSAPSRHDYHQLFTLQTLVSLALVGVLAGMVAIAPDDAYDVAGWKLACFLALAGGVTIPFTTNAIAKLERELDYRRLGLISAVQPIVFGVAASALVVAGLGVPGIGIGAAASFALSALVARLSHSPVGLTVDFHGLGTKLRFGVVYAGAQLLSAIKDAVVPLLLGLTLGAAVAGEVSWAQQFAVLPAFFAASFARYLFPVFARLAASPERLARAVTVSLAVFNAATAPLALALLLWPADLTVVIYGDQWLGVMPILLMLTAANLFAPTTSVLLALTNSLGRPHIALILTVIWFSATWALVPVFSLSLGYGGVGYAITNLILQIPSIILILIARRSTRFSTVRGIVLPWVVAGVVFGVAAAVSRSLAVADMWAISLIIVGAGSLALVAYVALYLRDVKSLIALYRQRESEIVPSNDQSAHGAIPDAEKNDGIPERA